MRVKYASNNSFFFDLDKSVVFAIRVMAPWSDQLMINDSVPYVELSALIEQEVRKLLHRFFGRSTFPRDELLDFQLHITTGANSEGLPGFPEVPKSPTIS